MKRWMVLFNKEILEMSRNYKIIWFPLVFIILGALTPLTTYYFPRILDVIGGLPEGSVIDIAVPNATEIMTNSLSDYNLFGILVLVITFMGIVATERNEGISTLTLLKPVPISSYISSKWVAVLLLTWISFILGILTSWYYTQVLFEDVSGIRVLNMMLVYSVWLGFVITLIIFFSSVMRSAGGAAATTIVLSILITTLTDAFSKWMTWSPGRLPSHASSFLITNEPE